MVTRDTSYGHFDIIDGTFVVRISKGHTYPRASIDELITILHAHRNNYVSAKDIKAEWYEAQLLHYGLQPSSVKDTAANSLLEALNQKTLKVPKRITKAEQIVREYGYSPGYKDEALDREAASPMNRIKAVPRTASKQAQMPTSDLSHDFSLLSLNAEREEGNIANGNVNNQGLCTFGASSHQNASLSHATHQSTPPRFRNGAQDLLSEEVIKTEPKPEGASPIPASPFPGPLGYTPLGLINGMYLVSCTNVGAARGAHPMTIILCLDTPRVWAAYDFGRYLGVFLLDQRPYRASDEPLPVDWRGREYGIGRMSPKEGDASWIAFLGNGEIEGCLEIDGNIGFWGSRIASGTTASPRDAWSMKEEWNSYVVDT